MSERNTFKLLFYINSSKIKKDGECPIMLRITINGSSSAFSIKRAITKTSWNSSSGLAIGRSSEISSLNKYIDAIRAKAYEKYTDLVSKYELVTPDLLRDAILGINSSESKMLLQVWQEHNDQLKNLIGKENSYTVWQKYSSCRSYFLDFLFKSLKRKDIPLKFVDRDIVLKFEHYLKTERNCAHNTTVKYMQQFKKIIRLGILNGWSSNDPFNKIKFGLKEVNPAYLSDSELRQIMDKQITIQRLATIRDVFIFSCFTGLSYSDIKKLNKSEIEIDADGSWWIRSMRQKTGVRANIPLLAIPKSILNKYGHLENKSDSDVLLPVASNQKVNAYLKELADVCGITKTITFHCARHTFATTVTLTHGVPIESVSKMLGHKNIKQTQHYARIVDLKVGEDMKVLSQRLGDKFNFANTENGF
jgi:site-specific recombinase XerD